MSDKVLKLVPTEIRGFFTDPPLLTTESRDQYFRLLEQFMKTLKPNDAIEWLWVKDITDYSWEALRLRRLKSTLVNLGMKRALTSVLLKIKDHVKTDRVAVIEQQASQWLTDPSVRIQVAVLLQEQGLDHQCVAAQAFVACLNTIESFASMEGFATVRRDSLLREMDRRRHIPCADRPIRVLDAPVAPPAILAQSRKERQTTRVAVNSNESQPALKSG